MLRLPLLRHWRAPIGTAVWWHWHQVRWVVLVQVCPGGGSIHVAIFRPWSSWNVPWWVLPRSQVMLAVGSATPSQGVGVHVAWGVGAIRIELSMPSSGKSRDIRSCPGTQQQRRLGPLRGALAMASNTRHVVVVHGRRMEVVSMRPMVLHTPQMVLR